jgi:hypothetical protein
MVVASDRGVRLNSQQQGMVDFILSAMRQQNRFIGGYGTAGTGKTFTAKYAVDRLMREGVVKKVGILAPINSACKTLKKAFDGRSKNIQTIASALGLAPVIDANGHQQFIVGGEKDRDIFEDREKPLSSYDLVIVDEGSMVGKSNWESLDSEIRYGAKILVLMDQWQLAPVGEKKIHALDLVGNNFRELTKTERYSEDSFIYKVISASLEAVKSKDKHFNPLAEFSNSVPENDYGHGYFVYDEKSGIESFARQVERMILTQKWDYTRCICWRNKEVDRINNIVRNLVIPYGDLESVTPGELLVTTGSVKRSDGRGKDVIIYPTATQLVVYSSRFKTVLDSDDQEWKIWETVVADPDEERGLKNSINLIDKDQRIAFQDKQDKLRDGIKKASEEYGYRSSEWFKALTRLTKFEQLIDPVRYCYAITGYGSQGQSVDTIYKNWTDISCNKRDFDARNRTNFVADSRARYRINVF